jgi:hypothetical protein
MSGRHVSQVDRTTQTPHSTHLIIPSGTQVVSRVEVRDAAGAVTCPRGATGVVMMRTGEVNASLVECNEIERLPYVDELIARKRSGGEHGTLSGEDLAFYEREYERLRERLVAEAARSALPEASTSADAIKDLLRRIRTTARAGV